MMTNEDEEWPKYPEINIKPRSSETKEHATGSDQDKEDSEESKK